MNYRRLGGSGLRISEISLGGWLTFGNALETDNARAIMDKAFDCGINFLDSSNVYAGGKCEEVWGDLLKGRSRSSYVLATKVFFPMGEGPNDRGLSRKHVFEQCHASLRRLKTDYIDLYQCHRHDPDTPLEETIGIMDDLVHQGKILYWGFSEWPAEHIEECLRLCGTRYVAPRSSQPQYNLLQRGIEAKVMPVCRRAGIGHVVWSPLAQGLLTGKYKPGQAPPAGSRATDPRQNYFIKDKAQDPAILSKVQKLHPIADELNCSLAQLALAWILTHPEVSSCIIGATRVEQVAENCAATSVRLTPETVRRIETVFA